MTMVTASGLISRWYRARLTTAMGVVFGGLGFGVLVVVPAVQYVIQHSGWRTAYHLIGGALLLFAPVLLILPWRRIAAGHRSEEHTSELQSLMPISYAVF